MANGILGIHPNRPPSDQPHQEYPVSQVSPAQIVRRSVLLRQAQRLRNTERYDWQCLGFLAAHRTDRASGSRRLSEQAQFSVQLCQAHLFDGSRLVETLLQPLSDRISLCCTTLYKSPKSCAVRWEREAYRSRRSRRPCRHSHLSLRWLHAAHSLLLLQEA